MPDQRTKEMREADEALREAIIARRRAYVGEAEMSNEVMSEYVVLTCIRYFDQDGDDASHYDMIFSEPVQPPHAVYGLVARAELLMKGRLQAHDTFAIIARDDDDDE